MQNFNQATFALAIAEDMIATRFGNGRGIHTFNDYLSFVDQRATAHLDAHMTQRIRATAGAHRRRARLRLETATTVIIAIPMNDTHKDKTIWAEIDLATWINAIEMGADSAWFFDHKDKDKRAGQVRTGALMRSTTTNKNVTIARLIVGARHGQQARTLDRNSLNLRAGNIYLTGDLATCEGRKGHAKTDSAAHLQKQRRLRETCRGADFGMPRNVEGEDVQ